LSNREKIWFVFVLLFFHFNWLYFPGQTIRRKKENSPPEFTYFGDNQKQNQGNHTYPTYHMFIFCPLLWTTLALFSMHQIMRQRGFQFCQFCWTIQCWTHCINIEKHWFITNKWKTLIYYRLKWYHFLHTPPWQPMCASFVDFYLFWTSMYLGHLLIHEI
jgi:hypothetical protein